MHSPKINMLRPRCHYSEGFGRWCMGHTSTITDGVNSSL